MDLRSGDSFGILERTSTKSTVLSGSNEYLLSLRIDVLLNVVDNLYSAETLCFSFFSLAFLRENGHQILIEKSNEMEGRHA